VPAVDVIALVRGGGSLEDLWSFNEEPLVRAIFASPIPVVSGVGHEIDVTLADLAADLRALTPTDAAVRIAPDGQQVAATLDMLGTRLQTGLRRRIDMARDRIGHVARSRIFADPDRLIRDRAAAVEQQAARLQRLIASAVDRGRERLAAAAARLEAGSPLKLLARGWSVTWLDTDATGPEAMSNPTPMSLPAMLKSVSGVTPGASLVTQLSDGKIWSRVERISIDDRQP
jgi:exodeoxyribonuclease VII large subunit